MSLLKSKSKTQNLISIFELWDRYESIAMHFNDLILKIRIQALATVTAISTLVGIINKVGSENQSFGWRISSATFFFLILFWLAIWVIDFKYYNRLLIGSVRAILELEKLSKTETHIQEIKLSMLIEEVVIGNQKREQSWYTTLSQGRWLFYSIVFAGLLIGLAFSIYEARYVR